MARFFIFQVGGEMGTFATYFESVYGDHETPQHNNLKSKFEEKYRDYYSNHISDNIMP